MRICCIYRSLDGNYAQRGQLIIILLIIIFMLQWLVVFNVYVFIHIEGCLYLYHHRSIFCCCAQICLQLLLQDCDDGICVEHIMEGTFSLAHSRYNVSLCLH